MRGAFHYIKQGEVYDYWSKSGGMQSHLSALDQKHQVKSYKSYVGDTNYLKKIAHTVIHPVELLQKLQENKLEIYLFSGKDL